MRGECGLAVWEDRKEVMDTIGISPELFQENVRDLMKRHDDLAGGLIEYTNTHRIQITKITQGSFQFEFISNTDRHCETRTVHLSLPDNQKLVDRYRQYLPDKQWLLVIGIDALHKKILESVVVSEFCPVLVIEPDFELFLSHLILFPYHSLMEKPQVYWLAGKRVYEDLISSLDGRLEPYFLASTAVFPITSIRLIGNQNTELKSNMAVFQKRFSEKKQEIQHVFSVFRQRYVNKPQESTRTVLITAPAVSCWIMIGNGFANGFRQFGYQVIEKYVPFPLSQTNSYDMLKRLLEIQRFCPDFVVTISHPSDLLVQGLENIPLPRFAYYVDEPNHLMHTQHGRFDYLFYVWRDFAKTLKHCGGQLAEELPIAGFPISCTRKNELCCEVGFVGTIKNTQSIHDQFPEEIKQKINAVTEAKLENMKSHFEDLFHLFDLSPNDQTQIIHVLKSIDYRHGMSDHQHLVFFFHVECIRKRRVRLLSALHPYDFKLFGNEDWDAILRDTPIYEAFQHRGLTSAECANFYHSAAISINIHPPFLHDGPMCRDMDIPMCDGFLLTDLHLHAGERIKEFFEPDQEIVLYETPEELSEKVEYYLAHPEERKVITDAAKERILKDHPYEKRAKQIHDYYRNMFHHPQIRD